jgi:hypothetical protein
MEPNKDMVIYKQDGTYSGGGYKIRSEWLNSNLPPMMDIDMNTENINQSGGGFTLGVLEGLAVPAGLLYLQQTLPLSTQSKSKPIKEEEKGTFQSSMYDKLLDLAQIASQTKKQRKTRKQNNKNQNQLQSLHSSSSKKNKRTRKSS